MVTSGLMVLVLSDSDVATAYFSEDDRQEGTPSSCTHQLCVSSVLGDKLFQGLGISGAGELAFPSLTLRNTGQQRLRSG